MSRARPALAHRGAYAFALAASLAALAGCAPATFNVRATRAFANEEAVPEVVIDRARDLAASRALLAELVVSTPYSPADGVDGWVATLGLDGTVGDRLKAELAAKPPYESHEHELPTVKIYRAHLERVARAAAAPRQAVYPSILDAVATLTPEAKNLKALWARYVRAVNAHGDALGLETHLADAFARQPRPRELPEGAAMPVPPALVDARRALTLATTEAANAEAPLASALDSLARADTSDPVRERVARDGLAVFSVALRVTLEGQALVPVLKEQAARAIQSAQRDLFTGGANTAEREERLGLSEVPARAQRFEASSAADERVLGRAVAALATNLHTEREATAGFRYRQSIVDQVVGVQWDSIRAHAKLDGEILFYNQLSTNGVAGDYTGRTRRLQYDVAPVAMVGARLMVAFDWLHLQNAATLNGAFTTDRLFGANGTIQTSGSLGERLGLSGFASDILDIGAGLVGIRTRLKSATFTAGQVREIAVDPATGRDTGEVSRAPLRLAFTQLDIGYDIAPHLPPEAVGRLWIEETVLGFRYMSYRLPRILYELKDAAPPGSDGQDFKFDRESPAQELTTQYYMGGGTLRFGQGEGRMVSLFGDLGFYGGAGPSRYSFANLNVEKPTVIVLDGSAGLGGRLRLTPRRSRLRVLLELQYHAEIFYQTVISGLRATESANGTTYTVDKKVELGGTDLFHGPRLQLVGVF